MFRLLLMISLLSVSVSSLVWAASSAKPFTFYVSPQGNDSWSGTLTAPNRAKTDGPFATITRARDAARALKDQLGGVKQPVAVYLREGTYYISEPLIFTPEDSGTAKYPITYASYKNEKPVISGGKNITGWKQTQVDGKKLWVVDLPQVKSGDWYFQQLFAGDRRLSRTRLPKTGFYRFAKLPDSPNNVAWNVGQNSVKYTGDDIKPWKNLGDVEITALHFWVDSHLPIASVDEATKTVTFTKPSVFRLSEDFGPDGTRFFVENVFEALDTPGQWYLDRKEGKLYYHASAGEDPNRMEFTAPRIAQLVVFDGSAESKRYVEYVNFDGISFQHNEWSLPSDKSGSPQAAVYTPGALTFRGTRFCSVKDCNIRHIGSYAIEFETACDSNIVSDSTMTDLGAGGVKIGPGCSRINVENNDIGDGGHIYRCAVGVWIGNSGHNKVLHNHIHDLYYTGVSVGWTWGYGASDAVDNEIGWNHIHHVGREWLSDLAGIYTLGISPGTVLHHNLIHDCISASYGGWGIYTDEGSSNILIKDNIVYNTKTGGFHQHYGKNNLIQNNIFAFSRQWQLQRTRQEPHTSFRFERNIVYYDQGDLLGSNWNDYKFKMDYNNYFNASGRLVTFAGSSIEDWRKHGMDVHSTVADPQFVDADDYNFALRPDSPAIKLGFQPIDLSTVGPVHK